MKMLSLVMPAVALAITVPAAAQVMTPAEFVKTAGASDLYERQSSQVVLQTTADPRVREFARMMIAHHTKSTADVAAAARRSRVPVARPMLMPLQAELMAQLRAEQGPARDARYLAQQKASHGQALAIQQAYAMEGTVPAIRTTAAAIVPVVQEHVAMLMGM